ncbi:hypothetical protein LguiA_017170 [Lonicera macranthoides]
MGNVLRFLCGGTTTGAAADSNQYLGHHGVSSATVGVSALAQDLYQFEINSQRESKPPPKTPEEASRLVIQTLKRHQKADVEGLLTFYGLPLPHSLVELSSGGLPASRPEGLKFELQTLPVDAKAVADGDTVTVYVSTAEPREASSVPREVQISAVQRSKARAERNYTKADALQKKITDAGYRVLNIQNEEVLAKRYRIRLRGIDAPEGSMPYGKEAKEELTKILQGKCLRVLVFDQDRYGRCVGDIYCNGIFVQVMFSSQLVACKWIRFLPESRIPDRLVRYVRRIIILEPASNCVDSNCVGWLQEWEGSGLGGRRRLGRSGLACGLHRTLRCLGNGGRTGVKADDLIVYGIVCSFCTEE